MTPEQIKTERERFEGWWRDRWQIKVEHGFLRDDDGYYSVEIEHAWTGCLRRAEIAHAREAELQAERDKLRAYGIELLQLKFEEYSEARFFATWRDGIELAIWQAAANGDTWAQKIADCAEALGVWLEWIDGEDGPTPVPLAEWRARMGGAG